MKNSRIKSRGILRSILVTLVVLLVAFVVFLTVFLTVYSETGKRLKSTAVNDSSQGLTNEVSNIQMTLDSQWTVITGNEFVQSVRQHLRDDNSIKNDAQLLARLLLTQKVMNGIYNANPLIQNEYILYMSPLGECLCCRGFITSNLKSDYENGLISFDGIPYSEFIQSLLSIAGNRAYPNGILAGRVSYRYTNGFDADAGLIVIRLSEGTSTAPLYAIMQLNMKVLMEQLTDLHYVSKDYLLLLDKVGNVVYSSRQEYEVPKQVTDTIWKDSEGHIYLRNYLSFLNVYCYIQLDENVIYSSIRYFNVLLRFLLIVVAGLLVSLAAVFFMRWNYPVIRFAEQLPGASGVPIERISIHIDELRNQSNEYQEKLSQMEPTVQHRLLTKLYCGKELTDDSYQKLTQITGIMDSSVLRCICIGSLNTQLSEEEAFELIHEIIKQYLPEVSAAAYFNQTYSAIIPITPKESESYSLLLEEALTNLNQACANCCFAIAVSNPYIGIRSVPDAYVEALEGWTDAHTWQNSGVIYFGTLEGKSKHYSVDYKQLDALYSFLCQGNTESALQIFDQLVDSNFRKNNDSRPQQLFCQQFYYDIVGILARLSTQFDLTDILNDLFSEGQQLSIEKMLAILRKSLSDCSELIPRRDMKHDISASICRYCEENYQDPAMSLSSIAEKFNFSESNMSKFIKTHTGVPYSVYIEDLRISKAVKLLSGTNQSIRDIATSVGYLNITTFYNAFRRKYGCTPSQWVESHREERNIN